MSINLDNFDVFEAFSKKDTYELKNLTEHFFEKAQEVKRELDKGVSPDEYETYNALYEALVQAYEVCSQEAS